MSLKEQLASDLKDAMRAKDETRKLSIRSVTAAIRNAEIAAGRAFTDEDVLTVLQREVKQRRDSIEEFGKANRADLVAKESAEMVVLQGYLPAQLSRADVEAEARAVIAETGATGPRDKGRVMPVLLKRLAGRAEGREVNAVVSELLGS